MSTIEVSIDASALMKRLRSGAATVAQALKQEMLVQMSKAADWSRANKLSGDPLHRRSGRLSRSVTPSAKLANGAVTGSIGTKVIYGRVHETGGVFQIPQHYRTTKRGEALVRAHNARFPQRAFLKPSVLSNRDQILAGLRKAATGAMKK